MNTYTTHLVRVGNSRGVRIPKALIEQADIKGELEISVRQGGLMIRSVHNRRAGWNEKFELMAKHGDDTLHEAPPSTEWDETEWTW